MFACVAFLSSFFMLSGCKKDNDNKNDGQVYLLSEIDHGDGGWIQKFEYDDKNRITKITGFYDGVAMLSYNNDGDLISMFEVHPDYPEYNRTTEFSKSGNIVTWNEDNGNISIKIELDTQGLPSKLMFESTEDNGDWIKQVVTLKYQGKNMIETADEWSESRHGVTSTGTGKSTFTYDNKKSSFYHCKTPEWFLMLYFLDNGLQNNMITAKNDYSSSYGYVYSDIFEYTYNDAGFPLTRTDISMEILKDEDGNEQTDTRTGSETYKYVNSSGEEYAVAQNKASNLSNVGVASQKREINRSNGQTFGNMFGNKPNRK